MLAILLVDLVLRIVIWVFFPIFEKGVIDYGRSSPCAGSDFENRLRLGFSNNPVGSERVLLRKRSLQKKEGFSSISWDDSMEIYEEIDLFTFRTCSTSGPLGGFLMSFACITLNATSFQP